MTDKQPSPSEKKPVLSDPRLARPEAPPPLVRTTNLVMWIALSLLLIALAWWGIARKLTWAPVILAALGILGAAFWLVLNLPALRRTAGTRSAKLVLNSVSFVLFVAGILVCLNVIVARHHPRLDLTEGHIFSLAPQTREVLKDLKGDVEMIAFLPEEAPGTTSARELVKLYASSSPRLHVTWADYTNVALQQQYEVRTPGTVVVKAGEKQEKVTDVTEQRLTSALLSVTTETKQVVYFLTGHGEASINGGQNGIAQLKGDLTNQQYDVRELNLAKMQQPAVPQDCAALAIIGAENAPAPQEMAALQKYLDNKGKLLLALAPPPAPDFASLLSNRGVTVLSGIVLDPESGYMGQPQAPMAVPTATGSPLTEGLQDLVFPLARGLQVTSAAPPPAMPGAPPPPSGPATALVSSSASAWLQPNLSAGLKKPANAQNGPFALVAAIDETPQPPPAMPGAPPPPPSEEDGVRIVVLSSAAAISDDFVRYAKFNSYLPLNAVAWLTKNTRLVSIPPKEEQEHPLLFSNTQKNFIIFLVMFFIPLALIVAGVSVWWTRRR